MNSILKLVWSFQLLFKSSNLFWQEWERRQALYNALKPRLSPQDLQWWLKQHKFLILVRGVKLSRVVYMGTRTKLRGRAFVVKENVTGFCYKAIMRARSLAGGQLYGAVISYSAKFPWSPPYYCNKEFIAVKIQGRMKAIQPSLRPIITLFHLTNTQNPNPPIQSTWNTDTWREGIFSIVKSQAELEERQTAGTTQNYFLLWYACQVQS